MTGKVRDKTQLPKLQFSLVIDDALFIWLPTSAEIFFLIASHCFSFEDLPDQGFSPQSAVMVPSSPSINRQEPPA